MITQIYRPQSATSPSASPVSPDSEMLPQNLSREEHALWSTSQSFHGNRHAHLSGPVLCACNVNKSALSAELSCLQCRSFTKGKYWTKERVLNYGTFCNYQIKNDLKMVHFLTEYNIGLSNFENCCILILFTLLKVSQLRSHLLNLS